MSVLISFCIIFCVFWFLWKIGLFTLKIISLLFLLLLIGLAVHILLWPAIIIILIVAGYNLIN